MLREKIIEFVYRCATGSRKIRSIAAPIGAVFYFTLIMLFIIAAVKLDERLRLPGLFPFKINLILSAPVIVMGLFLMLWSIAHFIKAKGTPVPLNPPPKLVTAGPYAFARNPMLTGIFILLLGIGILFNSISLIFIFMPCFILISALELKMIEEPELERRLGERYIRYKKNVAMFFPVQYKNQPKNH